MANVGLRIYFHFDCGFIVKDKSISHKPIKDMHVVFSNWKILRDALLATYPYLPFSYFHI